jgi:hypothetical protein
VLDPDVDPQHGPLGKVFVGPLHPGLLRADLEGETGAGSAGVGDLAVGSRPIGSSPMAGIRAAAAMLQPRSAKAGLTDPILVGPEAKIRSLAEGLKLDITQIV